MQGDLKTLGEQLSSLDLGASQKLLDEFTATHTSQMESISDRICSAITSRDSRMTASDRPGAANIYQTIKDSLDFPQIEHRRDQIPAAYKETYQWVLTSDSQSTRPWDNFLLWLRDPICQQRTYWVNGKIGAGKTVLMRYLEESLDPELHMVPWAEGQQVMRASYFFWGPGNKLQKCMAGLLRTLLLQIVGQLEDISLEPLMSAKWRAASNTEKPTIEWTDVELAICLKKCVEFVGAKRKLLILVDGLDEIEDHEIAQDALLELLQAVAEYPHVKIVVSSRPWNVFKDALQHCPGLRLEDLTQSDITLFTRQQLWTSKRYQFLLQHDSKSAERLVNAVVGRSAGVFLWVRLVVAQLLRSLRNGEGVISLQRRISEIPADLDDYFARLIQSIQPHDRAAASRLFQAALHTENDWITLHSNCLLDISFLEHEVAAFALEGPFERSLLDLGDKSAMFFRLDSALRSVNSLGMGLIECHIGKQPSDVQNFNFNPILSVTHAAKTSHMSYYFGDQFGVAPKAETEIDMSDPLSSASWTIDFLHRSLRDFLLTPKMQSLLCQYSQGPFDARMFYVNARIVQLVALARGKADTSTKLGLASTVLCGLGIPEYSDTVETLKAASIIRPIIETLATSSQRRSVPGWYINCVLRSWKPEESTFLTASIDFAMNSYVLANMTPQILLSKTGRPIMDHILRPRFVGCGYQMRTANQTPNIRLLHTVLQQGADPNEQYDNASVWALFLCGISDFLQNSDTEDTQQYQIACLGAMELLLHNTADVVIPEPWLSARHYYHCYIDHSSPNEKHPFPLIFRLKQRFRGAKSMSQRSPQKHATILVSELIGSLQSHFSLSMEKVKALALQKEAHLNDSHLQAS